MYSVYGANSISTPWVSIQSIAAPSSSSIWPQHLVAASGSVSIASALHGFNSISNSISNNMPTVSSTTNHRQCRMSSNNSSRGSQLSILSLGSSSSSQHVPQASQICITQHIHPYMAYGKCREMQYTAGVYSITEYLTGHQNAIIKCIQSLNSVRRQCEKQRHTDCEGTSASPIFKDIEPYHML